MTTNIDSKSADVQQSKKVWLVADFCRRYRLEKAEEQRLLSLLGQFASEQELLMNSKRNPVFR